MNKAQKLIKTINEASLSRIYDHMKNHDCGTITAYRSAKDCNQGDPYTRNENQKRNKSLLAKLSAKRYGIISVKGSYIENYGSKDAKEVGERVFFVFDKDDTGKLKKDLIKFGKEFEQDSILFIPKGGESAKLIGTNNCPNTYPGLGKTVNFNKRQWGKSGEFFTRVKGRPFLFESKNLEEIASPEGFFGRWGCNSVAKQKWEDVEI